MAAQGRTPAREGTSAGASGDRSPGRRYVPLTVAPEVWTRPRLERGRFLWGPFAETQGALVLWRAPEMPIERHQAADEGEPRDIEVGGAFFDVDAHILIMI